MSNFIGGLSVSGLGGAGFGGVTQSTAGKSWIRTALDHLFDGSFQGRTELLNLLQYGLTCALIVPLALALLDAATPEVNFHTSTPVMLLEVFVYVSLLLVLFLATHRLATLLPALSGVQFEKMAYTHAVIPLLLLSFGGRQGKIPVKLTILGDRLRAALHLPPRGLPGLSYNPNTQDGGAASSGGGGGGVSTGTALVVGGSQRTTDLASLPFAPTAFGGGSSSSSGGGGFSSLPGGTLMGVNY